MDDDYTFDNVLIDPNKEGIESLIGKEVYFNDNPSYCLMHANEKSTNSLGVLVKIIKNSANPFRVEQNGTVYLRQCIIPKKEEPKPKYVPFTNLEEFLGSHSCVKTDNLDRVHRYLDAHGIWLKDKRAKVVVYCMVTEVWDSGLVICAKRMRTDGIIELDNIISWIELYEGFTFLDGSPCGKLKENK